MASVRNFFIRNGIPYQFGVTDSDQEWSHKDQWEDDSERDTEGEEVADSCELAPHSAMSVGAGRVDSPSPQDIRLLHDLVEDLTKEQEEKIRPRAEQSFIVKILEFLTIFSFKLLTSNSNFKRMISVENSDV
ncbi:hypothetical protein E2986_12230 [Frieseomelitta varia]|uniref:Uncharacterized protein n=1 Tax=Frieseomelitta varia TaxID=561572 RepID=A0A833VSF0_9HYME|nr:hypothetical protein E2986_12230 [Frieseomelitta varia]